MTLAPAAPEESEPARPSAVLLVAAGAVLAWHGVAGAHLWDAGELVAASVALGGSHAPGQPLHALLGHLAALLPIGPIPFRITLLSVACACGAAWILGRTAAELAARERASRDVQAWAANAALLAVLVAPPVLRQAVRPEVYAPALLVFSVGARALVPWTRGEGGARGVALAAFAAGLLLGLHPPHALALVLVGAVGLVRRVRSRRPGLPKVLGLGALAFVLGSLVLAYLPIRGVAGAPMWGQPTSLAGFFAYASGSAYRGNLGGGSTIATLLAVSGYLLACGAAIPVLALALAARQREEGDALPWLGLATLAALAAALLQPHEERNPDNVAYVAPALVIALLVGAAAAARLSRSHRALGAALIVALPLQLGLVSLPVVLRADAPPLETTAFALADAPAACALVVVRSDFVAASLMMTDAVDRLRPDVALMVEGLSSSSWHWRSLRHHPSFERGVPVRGPGEGHEAWTRGAISRATDVPIFVERAALLEDGWLDGFYLRTPIAAASASGPPDLRARASSGERFVSLPVAAIAWMPAGDHGHARDVVRELALHRAERLFARGLGEEAQRTLAAALADAPWRSEPLGLLGAPVRPPPPWVRDPGAIFASHADGERFAARLLFASGQPAAATDVLAGQNDAGDDRATLQLAWMLASDGMTDRAAELVEAYAAIHGRDETAELEAALRVRPSE